MINRKNITYEDEREEQKVRKIKMGVVSFICLLLASLPALVSARSGESMTTLEFTQILQPLDTAKRLDLSSASSTPLTREKAAAIVVKLMGYEGIAQNYKTSTLFNDVTTYKGEIHIVKELGIMSGVTANNFNPKGQVTKEQGQVIYQRLQNKIGQKTNWNHAFYALSSSSQMELIPNYDAVSFGWAQVSYNEATQNFNLEWNNAKNDFKVPAGFAKPLDLAKANGAETYLMIFFEDQGGSAKKLLNNTAQRDALINQIVSLCNQISKDGVTRSFDGVTIDFENFISSELKEPYNQFLKKLRSELKKTNKKLNVAVQPTTHFKGYDYKTIGEASDKVILMAHDYAPKTLTPFEQEIGRVMTPITPISEIYKDFKAITNPISGVQDLNKIALQISYGATQWQLKENKVIHTKPYTPTYDKIYERLNKNGTKSVYSEVYQNPYATYEENGIKNIIWYENNKSVEAKINLAKLFNINNVSYWRLGTIPTYE